MIEGFVKKFMDGKGKLEEVFKKRHPESYKDLVVEVARLLGENEDDDDVPDFERVHQIDDGDYQGTLVYVIGAKGYQPSIYWYVKISYGSCSGCDTLEGIKGYSDDPSTDEQVKDYIGLCLNIVQGLKIMGEEFAI